MAIEYVLEAACGIQEVYSLPEMSLLSNVTQSFLYTYAFFFIIIIITIMKKKNGIPLCSSKIL